MRLAIEAGVGPLVSVAPPGPVIVRAEGARFWAAAVPVLTTRILTVNVCPELTTAGWARKLAERAVLSCTVAVLDVAVAEETAAPVTESLPTALPENVRFPALAPAVYCHVNVCELPGAILAVAGVGPLVLDAVLVPLTKRVSGATFVAEEPPVLVTTIVTLKVCAVLMGDGMTIAEVIAAPSVTVVSFETMSVVEVA